MNIKQENLVLFFFVSLVIFSASSDSSRRIVTSVQSRENNTRSDVKINSSSGQYHTKRILVGAGTAAGGRGGGFGSKGGRGLRGGSRSGKGKSGGGFESDDEGTPFSRTSGNEGRRTPVYAAGAANGGHHHGASGRTRFGTLTAVILVTFLIGHAR